MKFLLLQKHLFRPRYRAPGAGHPGAILLAYAMRLSVALRGIYLGVLNYSRQVALPHLVAVICLSILQGCTSYTHERLLRTGEIDSFTFDSGEFEHRLFRAATPAPKNSADRLHIYLGGDGNPWRTARQVARDPTSERSIMLKNMLRDDSETVYVGRPCYYQVTDSRCQGSWWTHDRYHPEVVNSLLKVVEKLAANHQKLWLIGHSGGGTLAVLVGRRLDRPVKVVTVSANLDHKAWTAHHQYSPLTGSLNPIRDTARNPDMQELHWYATEDRTVLPKWVLAYCEQHQARCLPISGSHNDGWPARWPSILRCSHRFFAQRSLLPEGRSHAEQKMPPQEPCLSAES